MDKYTKEVPWSKTIVQKYDIICFRGNVYRAQSQNATVNFNFSRHVQFLHALFTKLYRSYFIPVLYVYINKRKKNVWTVFRKYI